MAPLHFVKQGSGPSVVLSHALGCELGMWDEVATALQDRFTVLRYDHRGHGRSAVTPGPFSIDDLADDAAALIEQTAGGPVHFAGLSMGGMVAQSLAARHPQRVRSIVIANSASYYDEAAQTQWNARVQGVLANGVASIAEGALQRWFTPEFRADAVHGGAARVQSMRARLEQCDPLAYAASCQAVARIDFRQSNPRITCPTLVIAGDRDEATPPALTDEISREIAGAQFRSLPTAHLSAVEQPARFAALLAGFWQGL
jgi:3-oxoadipate enol-lactonase